jgi:hypothetical protein
MSTDDPRETRATGSSETRTINAASTADLMPPQASWIIAAQALRDWTAKRWTHCEHCEHMRVVEYGAAGTAIVGALEAAGYTVATRASQSPERHARPEGDTGDGRDGERAPTSISALQDRLVDLGRRALFARTYDAPRIDQALIDISTDLARIAQHDIPAIREQAVREERERLSAVFTERAERAGTADLRRHMEIAARVAAPELTPEEITQAIKDGNYTVCHVPEDPARGEGR